MRCEVYYAERTMSERVIVDPPGVGIDIVI
jgi:hypothetical protein